jgi:hypothetical protein
MQYSPHRFCRISSRIGPITSIPSPFSIRGASGEAFCGVKTAAAARGYCYLIPINDAGTHDTDCVLSDAILLRIHPFLPS